MAHGDRKGPDGLGPMTGRGAGFCSGSGKPGYMNGMGRGLGSLSGSPRGSGRRSRGQGGGRGRSFGFSSDPAAFDEKEMPRNEAEIMKKNLEALQNRLKEQEGKEPSGE